MTRLCISALIAFILIIGCNIACADELINRANENAVSQLVNLRDVDEISFRVTIIPGHIMEQMSQPPYAYARYNTGMTLRVFLNGEHVYSAFEGYNFRATTTENHVFHVPAKYRLDGDYRLTFSFTENKVNAGTSSSVNINNICAYGPPVVIPRIINGGFEGREGWTISNPAIQTSYDKRSGGKSLGYIEYDANYSGSASQVVSLTNVSFITFWGKKSEHASGNVAIDNGKSRTYVNNTTWEFYTINVHEQEDNHDIKILFDIYGKDNGSQFFLIDDVNLIVIPNANRFKRWGFEQSGGWEYPILDTSFATTYYPGTKQRVTAYAGEGYAGYQGASLKPVTYFESNGVIIGHRPDGYGNQIPIYDGTVHVSNDYNPNWEKIASQSIDLTNIKDFSYWSKGDIKVVIDSTPFISHMGSAWAKNTVDVRGFTGVKTVEVWARNGGAAVDTFEAYEENTIQYSYIYGSVRNTYDGVGIDGANVSVVVDGKTYATNTDSTGAYFLMFPEGSRSIQFSAFGYMDDTIENEFTKDVFYEYNAHLVSKFKTFSGIVIDATTGNRVGAGVNISTVQAGVYSNTSTDVNGRFSLSSIVPLYAITVTATHENYTHAPVTFVVPLMESPEFVANLYVFPVSFAPVGNSIYGLIYGEYGQPVAWANISISMSGNTMSRIASETGFYLFEDITAGQYAVNITAAEHRPSDYSVYVQNGTRQDFYMLKLQVMPGEDETGAGAGVVPAGMILQRFRLIDISNTHKLSACQMRLDLTENNKTSTVFSSFFDFNARTSTYLNLTKMYTLYVILPDNTTINYGLYSPDPDGNTEIYIGELNIYLRDDWIKYGFSKSDAGVISLDYTSELDIESCSFVVYSNESVAYSAITNTKAGSFTYAGNTTKNYRVTFIAKSTTGKKIEITKFVSWSGDGVQPIRLHILPESAPGWLYNMISIAIIVITLLIFGQYRMEVGCVMVAVMTGLTWYWGWFQVNGIIVAVVCIIAIAAVMQRTRRA